MNFHDIEELLAEVDREETSIEKTASANPSVDLYEEAMKVAHALRHVPVSETFDLHAALEQATKLADSKAREFFGAKKGVFKPLDWEDGLFVMTGGKYDY